jgi:hypothetical protein
LEFLNLIRPRMRTGTTPPHHSVAAGTGSGEKSAGRLRGADQNREAKTLWNAAWPQAPADRVARSLEFMARLLSSVEEPRGRAARNEAESVSQPGAGVNRADAFNIGMYSAQQVEPKGKAGKVDCGLTAG